MVCDGMGWDGGAAWHLAPNDVVAGCMGGTAGNGSCPERESERGGLLSGLPLTHNVFFGIISCSEDPPSLSALLCSA